jgi:hypothetical protein
MVAIHMKLDLLHHQFVNDLFSIGKWVDSMSESLGYNWLANSFGNLLNFWNTINLVDYVALFNGNGSFHNNWGVQAMLGYNFVARMCDGFFVGGNMIGSSIWESVISEKLSICFTLENSMSSKSRGSTVLAGDFFTKLFVGNGLGNYFLGLTNMFGSWGTNLGLNHFSSTT